VQKVVAAMAQLPDQVAIARIVSHASQERFVFDRRQTRKTAAHGRGQSLHGPIRTTENCKRAGDVELRMMEMAEASSILNRPFDGLRCSVLIASQSGYDGANGVKQHVGGKPSGCRLDRFLSSLQVAETQLGVRGQVFGPRCLWSSCDQVCEPQSFSVISSQ